MILLQSLIYTTAKIDGVTPMYCFLLVLQDVQMVQHLLKNLTKYWLAVGYHKFFHLQFDSPGVNQA